MEYISAEEPYTYWINKITYLCDNCGTIYDIMLPIGDELIKFVESEGNEERWLPTYEKGGYLDLLEKMVPNFKRNNKITVQIAKEFDDKFSKIQQRSSRGRKFIMDVSVKCPKCDSKNSIIKKIESLENPVILWMCYRSISSST